MSSELHISEFSVSSLKALENKISQMNPNDYAGDLPQNCPPADAKSAPNAELLRMVTSKTPTMEDFKSVYQLTGRVRPKVPWYMSYGLSLYTSEKPLHKLRDLTKLPKLKHLTHVARLKVTPNDGSVLNDDPTSNGHYCFYRKRSFNPVAMVVGSEAL